MSSVSGGWDGPSIVKDGLVLYLDAGSPNSFYPLTAGTTWKDISGNAYNGTLINGPAYSTANGGSIVFDGVDDYVNLESARTQVLTLTSQVTFDITFKMTQWVNNFYNGILALGRNPDPGAGTQAYFLSYIDGGGSGKYFAQFGESNGNAGLTVTSSLAISTNIIYNFTVTYNNGITILYQNSSQTSTVTNSTNTIYNTNQNRFYLGGDSRYNPGTSGRYFKGDVYNLKIYNRALSSSEINQNFQATRARFGI